MRKKIWLLLLGALILTACGKSVSFPTFTAAPEEEIPVYYTAHDFSELDFPVYYFLREDGTIAYRAYANGTFYKIALTATNHVALDTKVEPVAVTTEEPYGIPERAANAPNESRWERVIDGLYRIPVEEFYIYRVWGRIGNVTAFFPATEKGEFLPGGTPDVHTIGKRQVRLMAPGSKGTLLKTEAAEVRLATKLVNDEEQKIYHEELEKKHAEQRKIDREREERWAHESPGGNRPREEVVSTENRGREDTTTAGGNTNTNGHGPGTDGYDGNHQGGTSTEPQGGHTAPAYEPPSSTMHIVPANSFEGIEHHLEERGE